MVEPRTQECNVNVKVHSLRVAWMTLGIPAAEDYYEVLTVEG